MSGVRIRDAKPRQDHALKLLHRLGVAVLLVVVADQMQETMHRKMGEMMGK